MRVGDETKMQSKCVYKINVCAYEFQRNTFKKVLRLQKLYS